MASTPGSVASSDFTPGIDQKATDLKTKIDTLANSSEMSPGQMLSLQFDMNLFAQFLETTTNFVGVMHEGQKNMIRNLK